MQLIYQIKHIFRCKQRTLKFNVHYAMTMHVEHHPNLKLTTTAQNNIIFMVAMSKPSTGDCEERRVDCADAKETAASICQEFTQSTTLHGIQYVFKRSSKKKRIIWLLCLLVFAACYVHFMLVIIVSYFSYDVISHIRLINQDVAQFPAVTICNFNPIRKDYVEKNNLQKLLSLFSAEPFTKADWDALGQNLTKTSIQKIHQDGSHRLSDMLYSCSFGRMDCGTYNFTPVFTRIGLCHTFNKGMCIYEMYVCVQSRTWTLVHNI